MFLVIYIILNLGFIIFVTCWKKLKEIDQNQEKSNKHTTKRLDFFLFNLCLFEFFTLLKLNFVTTNIFGQKIVTFLDMY